MTSFADTVSRRVTHMTDAEVRALLKATGEHRDGFRDHVLFSVALATGLREHELAALSVGDVMLPDGRTARRRVELKVFKRASSEPAKQEVLLPETVRLKIARLVQLNRDAHPEFAGPDAPLFISREGNRISTRTIRHVFAVWQGRAGMERRVHVHALRHTACTNFYAITKDIRATQRFARHKSITTTSIYTHPSDDEMMRAVERIRC